MRPEPWQMENAASLVRDWIGDVTARLDSIEHRLRTIEHQTGALSGSDPLFVRMSRIENDLRDTREALTAFHQRVVPGAMQPAAFECNLCFTRVAICESRCPQCYNGSFTRIVPEARPDDGKPVERQPHEET